MAGGGGLASAPSPLPLPKMPAAERAPFCVPEPLWQMRKAGAEGPPSKGPSRSFRRAFPILRGLGANGLPVLLPFCFALYAQLVLNVWWCLQQDFSVNTHNTPFLRDIVLCGFLHAIPQAKGESDINFT